MLEIDGYLRAACRPRRDCPERLKNHRAHPLLLVTAGSRWLTGHHEVGQAQVKHERNRALGAADLVFHDAA